MYRFDKFVICSNKFCCSQSLILLFCIAQYGFVYMYVGVPLSLFKGQLWTYINNTMLY